MRNLGFDIGAVHLPARARHFVGVAVIAVLHHIIDAHAPIAVVVVVGLPEGAVTVGRYFIVVAEIVPQHLEMCKIGVAAKHHALAVVFGVDVFSIAVFDRLALAVLQHFTCIAEVEIEFSVGAEHDGVQAVVVLMPADALQDNFFFIGFVVAVFIGEQPEVRALRNDDPVAHNPDAERRFYFRPLVKYRAFVGLSVAVAVFQDQDAVAFRVHRIAVDLGAVVVGLAKPDAAPVVDIHVGGIGHHRL